MSAGTVTHLSSMMGGLANFSIVSPRKAPRAPSNHCFERFLGGVSALTALRRADDVRRLARGAWALTGAALRGQLPKQGLPEHLSRASAEVVRAPADLTGPLPGRFFWLRFGFLSSPESSAERSFALCLACRQSQGSRAKHRGTTTALRRGGPLAGAGNRLQWLPPVRPPTCPATLFPRLCRFAKGSGRSARSR